MRTPLLVLALLALLAAVACGDLSPAAPSATGQCISGPCAHGSLVNILD